MEDRDEGEGGGRGEWMTERSGRRGMGMGRMEERKGGWKREGRENSRRRKRTKKRYEERRKEA